MDETVLIESLFRQINEWKEKAKELDNIADSGRGIWKWSDVREWQEKAKKWDEHNYIVRDYDHYGYTVAAKAKWYDENREKLEEKSKILDNLIMTLRSAGLAI